MNEELIKQIAREASRDYWMARHAATGGEASKKLAEFTMEGACDQDDGVSSAAIALRLYHARHVAPLVEAAEALVNMIEHSMTGMVHPEKGRFIKGVTDLDITPDGSVKLSHAREALAPFQQEKANAAD